MAITSQARLTLISLCLVLLSGCALFAPSYPAVNSSSSWTHYDSELSSQLDSLVFTSSNAPLTAIVFYPGGKVAPEAYGDFANSLSEQTGALVVIPPMPLDLAVLGKNKGADIQQQLTDIEDWVIGGHSLGGTMAASLVFEQPQNWNGLFFLASYPQEKHDFANTELAVLSLIGDQDGLIELERWQESLKLLPANTSAQIIKGGNHAYFGHYGEQSGDQAASITQASQQAQTVDAISQWLINFESSLNN